MMIKMMIKFPFSSCKEKTRLLHYLKGCLLHSLPDIGQAIHA